MAAKSKPVRRKKLILLVVILILLTATLIITKSYLVINQLIGNDLIIKLDADQENLFLKHNEQKSIKFQILATTNPFCTIQCKSEFYDISTGKTIEEDSFKLNSAVSKTKEYNIAAEEIGEGQKLYSFKIACTSKRNILCHTEETPRKRNLLITLNYEMNDEEQEIKISSEENLIYLMKRIDYSNSYLSWLNENIENISSIDFNSDIIQLVSINQTIDELENEISNRKLLWERQEYNRNLSISVNKLKENSTKIQNALEQINNSISLEIKNYNKLLENLTRIQINLEKLKFKNISDEDLAELNFAFDSFNNNVSVFIQKSSLENKKKIVDSLSQLEYVDINDGNGTVRNFNNLTEAPKKIDVKLFNYSEKEIILKNPTSQCCFLNNCSECSASSESPELYPIILMHGHDFNKYISAEHSLDSFQKIQEKLEEEGYLNAGALILSTSENTQKGIWGKIQKPISVRASYYFDIYNTEGKGRVIETKTDNIDTYALRLKDIIETIKLKTGKDKVIIISHSMGGLVSRRYIEIFGDNNVEKLIMIGTPNKGVDEDILRYCLLFGEKAECDNMDKNSLFINKLNNFAENRKNFYSIIGIGCETDSGTGDGIVKNESAYLDDAKNFFIQGECDDLKFVYLHEEMLDIEKYPDVFETIKKALKD
ncbi:MAG: alpha/beta fold hydrolase [Nanoarchaeota archaeon]